MSSDHWTGNAKANRGDMGGESVGDRLKEEDGRPGMGIGSEE